MPKKTTLNQISEAIRRGSVKNIELNSRLVKYKRKERQLSDSFGNMVLDQDSSPAYQAAAKDVGEAWIELVVDMASFYGEGLDRSYVKSLREVLFESIAESTNRFQVPKDPAATY